MKEQIEEFLANLLSAGFRRDQVSEKGYEFAIALQSAQQLEGTPVSPAMMSRAAELVKDAFPGAYRIVELRNRMH